MKWLGVCLDMICVVFVAFVVFLAIATQSGSGKKKSFVNQCIQVVQNNYFCEACYKIDPPEPSLSFDTFVSSFPLAESPPRDLHITSVLTCFAVNNILLMRNWNHFLERKMADRFPELPGSD